MYFVTIPYLPFLTTLLSSKGKIVIVHEQNAHEFQNLKNIYFNKKLKNKKKSTQNYKNRQVRYFFFIPFFLCYNQIPPQHPPPQAPPPKAPPSPSPFGS